MEWNRTEYTLLSHFWEICLGHQGTANTQPAEHNKYKKYNASAPHETSWPIYTTQ